MGKIFSFWCKGKRDVWSPLRKFSKLMFGHFGAAPNEASSTRKFIEFNKRPEEDDFMLIDLDWDETRQQKTSGLSKKDFDEVFHGLKAEDEKKLFHILGGGHSNTILVTHEASNIAITVKVLQCLRPGGWLNDEVINLYLELLKEREKREPTKFLKCHFFNTFFFKKLTSEGNELDFPAVKRWTAKKKLGYTLMECDKVFFPIHKNKHWCLAVADIKAATFLYLDSLGGMDTYDLNVLETYFMMEVWDKGDVEVDTTFWKRESVNDLPLQQNAWDCGMFMLKYIDFYSRGLKMEFSQENIDYFRYRTAIEILNMRAE